MAQWLLPRLRRFREVTISFPSYCNDNETMCSLEQWKGYIDEMIYAWEIVKDDLFHTEYDKERYERGMRLFHQYLTHLWW